MDDILCPDEELAGDCADAGVTGNEALYEGKESEIGELSNEEEENFFSLGLQGWIRIEVCLVCLLGREVEVSDPGGCGFT